MLVKSRLEIENARNRIVLEKLSSIILFTHTLKNDMISSNENYIGAGKRFIRAKVK